MSSAIEALQKLAQAQYKPKARKTPLAKQIEKTVTFNRTPIKVVDIDTDSNEINVHFMANPSEKEANDLFRQGFKWQIGSNTYLIDYTREACAYISANYEVQVDYIPSDNLPLGMEIRPSAMALPEVVEDRAIEPQSEDVFARYKRQVDELCLKLKIDRTELLFLAIEHLYQAKLSN